MAKECIFCKIVAGSLPAQIVAQNEDVMVIKDINPRAPIHYLILPKKHVADIGKFEPGDHKLAGDLLMMATKLSLQEPKAREFRLVSNNGTTAGQIVFHIHLHFLAGEEFS